MHGGDDRHAALHALADRPDLLRTAKLIQKHHIGRKTPYRLQDPLRLAATGQHVTAVQGVKPRKLSALIYDSYPQPGAVHRIGKLPRQIAQQTGFSARRFTGDEQTVRPPIGKQGADQLVCTPLMRAGDTQTERGDAPKRPHLPLLRHRFARHAAAAAVGGADKPLPQLLLMRMHRIAAQAQKRILYPSAVALHQ